MMRSGIGDGGTLDREHRQLAPVVMAILDALESTICAMDADEQPRLLSLISPTTEAHEGQEDWPQEQQLVQSEVDELRRSVERMLRAVCATTPVPASDGGGVERGNSIAGVKGGVHIHRRADGSQHTRQYSRGELVGQPRPLAAWEALPAAFFAS